MRRGGKFAPGLALAMYAACVGAQTPGAPTVFRQDPKTLSDRDVEFVAKDVTYAAGRPRSGGDDRAAGSLTIKGDKAFRASLAANNFSFVDSIDTEKGFQAILIRDNATGRVIMSVRGTEAEGTKDYRADAATAATVTTGQAHPGLPQYDAEVKAWVGARMVEHNGNIIVTGHSLGGAHAQRIALDHAGSIAAAQTYNAPALETAAIEPVANDPKRLRALFDAKGNPKVRHFVGTGDPVSAAGSLHVPGDVVVGSGGAFKQAGVIDAHSYMINDPSVRRATMAVEDYNRHRTMNQLSARTFAGFATHAVYGTLRYLTELHPAALYDRAVGEPTVGELEARLRQGRSMIQKEAMTRGEKIRLNERDKAKLAVAQERAKREEADRKLTIDAVRAERPEAFADAGPMTRQVLEQRAEKERMAAAERRKARERRQARQKAEQAALLAAAADVQKDLELASAAVPELPPIPPAAPPSQQEIAEVVAAFAAIRQQEAQRQRALAEAIASFGAAVGQAFAGSGARSGRRPPAPRSAPPPAPSKSAPGKCGSGC